MSTSDQPGRRLSSVDTRSIIDENIEPPQKRRRAIHACDLCRHRKIRCDGRKPCDTCRVARISCVYGAEAGQKTKSDQILDGVIRLEKQLKEVNALIISNAASVYTRIQTEYSVTPGDSHSIIRAEDQSEGRTSDIQQNRIQDSLAVHNAILSAQHTSATESMLEWPMFDAFPSFRQRYVPIFTLEQSRTPVEIRSSSALPYLSNDEVRYCIQSFQSSINFYYPTMSKSKLDLLQERICTGNLDPGIETCLALLVMALGCASQTVNLFFDNICLDPESLAYQTSRKTLAKMYFDNALKSLAFAHLETTTDATQCLFFASLYFAYLQRPLQAWQYINSTATRCRLLLSYQSKDSSSEQECIKRMFWSCYILESDYLAELSALPQSGIANIESSIALPDNYNTRDDSVEEEQSSLYFLACISMRRLLNRVHDLLYAPETGASLSDARIPSIVSELAHQLEEWRECLPASLHFTIDTQPVATQHGGFLRQRFLTCRSVIYRPYLTRALFQFFCSGEVDNTLITKSKICLDACILHMLNLKGYCHTVLIDTWICSLSMAGGMIILLLASRVPSLCESMGSKATTIGKSLTQLLEPWMLCPGGSEMSPSVQQSLRMIANADELIERKFAHYA